MNYSEVQAIYFSPTHTSMQVSKKIADSTELKSCDDLDLTYPFSDDVTIENRLAVIAVPVYGGRVAPLALQRLKKIKAKDVPCIIVTVYGNRDYDDALLELRNEVTKLGFTPIVAAAFIGEHSYSTDEYPIAKNRPDNNDLEIASNLGREAIAHLLKIDSLNGVKQIEVKGNYPYKDYSPSPATPSTSEELCTQCGHCISICPVECIKLEDEIVSDPNLCIKCCACVKECPNQARLFKTPYSELLSVKCASPKAPEVYFSL